MSVFRQNLRACDSDLGQRADSIWNISEQIHDKQTRPDANECGRKHCEHVEHNIWRLIDETAQHKKFKPLEMFLLSCAACCHDFDKGLYSALPAEFEHGTGSASFVVNNADTLQLPAPEATAVSFIVSVHDLKGKMFSEKLSELSDKFATSHAEIDLQRLAVLFKTADVLHTDSSRVSTLAVDVEKLQEEDRSKHLARQSINGWILDGSRITLQAYPKSQQCVEAVLKCEQYISQYEWAPMTQALRRYGFPNALKLHIDSHHIEMKPGAVAAGFIPGMDFYHEADAQIYTGRDREIIELLGLAISNAVSLLVGPSGIGKTSLVHAGLIPKFKGYSEASFAIVTRPNKVTGRFFTRSSFRDAVGVAPSEGADFAELCSNARQHFDRILVVVDQFEDVAYFGRGELLDVVDSVHEAISKVTDLHILFVYRDEVESIVAPLWKEISHSASGLPRCAIQSLKQDDAKNSLRLLLKGQGLTLDDSLETSVLEDLERFSARTVHSSRNAVYPPFLQILAQRLLELSHSGQLTATEYMAYETERASPADQLISEYLLGNLAQVEPLFRSVDAQNALVSLSHSTGKKGIGKLAGIAAECNLSIDTAGKLLSRMSDLRLVRRLDDDHWEIAHDLLAMQVKDAFIGERELSFKRAREGLAACAIHFREDRSILTRPELLNLWKGRDLLEPQNLTEDERLVLFCSLFSPDVTEFFRDTSSLVISQDNAVDPLSQLVPGWYWFSDLSEYDFHEFLHKAIETELPGCVVGAMRCLEVVGTHEDLHSLLSVMRLDWQGFYAPSSAARELFLKLISEEERSLVLGLMRDMDAKVREIAVAGIGLVGLPEDMRAVRAAWDDDDWEVRRQAVWVTGSSGSMEYLDDLLQLTQDPNDVVRADAVGAVTRLGGWSGYSELVEFLREESSEVALAGKNAVDRIMSCCSAKALAEAARDKNHVIRLCALNALGKLKAEPQMPIVVELLSDHESEVRQAAVSCLASFSSHEALRDVAKLIHDESPFVRKTVAEVLGSSGSSDYTTEIRLLLEDQEGDVRSAALGGLGCFESVDGLVLLRNFLRNCKSYPVPTIYNVTDALVVGLNKESMIELLSDGSGLIRKAAVDALGDCGDVRVAVHLEGMIDDADHGVRATLPAALAKLMSKRTRRRNIGNWLGSEDITSRQCGLVALEAEFVGDYSDSIEEMFDDSDQNLRLLALWVAIRSGLSSQLGPVDLGMVCRDASWMYRSDAAIVIDSLLGGDVDWNQWMKPELLKSVPMHVVAILDWYRYAPENIKAVYCEGLRGSGFINSCLTLCE